jgi:hypothetical protein
LIEILLQAREQVSAAAQKAVRALDDVTKSQDKMSESSKLAARASQEQRAALQQLQEARIREKRGLDDEAAALRNSARSRRESASAARDQARQSRESVRASYEARDAARAAQLASLREASSLLKLADARQQQIGTIDKTVSRLRTQANEARKMADSNRLLANSYQETISSAERNAASFERSAASSENAANKAASDARKRETAASRVANSVSTTVRQIARLDAANNTSTQSSTRMGRALDRVGLGSRSAASELRGLNSEFRGLLFAAAIKYAQSLVSVLVTLAAQLFSVASAATQAAAGIGAALGAGMAQAIPVAGVLVATFGRLTSILKAVKLQNQQQLTATHDTAAAERRQASAADALRAAEERVADAHRNTARAVQDLARTRSDAARQEIDAQREVVRAQQDGSRNIVKAQEDVTQARKDAIRTVEDLITAEEDAFQQLERARSGLTSAIQGGDVAGAVQAQIDVSRAQTGLTRAREDAAPVRRGGVEAVADVQQAEERLAETRRQSVEEISIAERRLGDVRRTNERQVASAEQQVADARRQEARASDDLTRTRVNTTRDLEQETAAVDKLADSLKQLSPAERDLYRRIIALQEVYRRAARPITDIIVRAFSGVVDRVTQLLRDPRILRGFRNIAVQIAASIRTATREAGGERSIGAFQIITDEAARNIPIVTRIITNLFRTARNLVLDALPAFRLLLGYVEDYSKRAEDASGNSRGITEFFKTGVRYAKAFFDLALSVIGLFLALSGSGGAADEGIKTIDTLTDRIDGLTEKVRANAGKIRAFFASTREPLNALIGLIGDVGAQIIASFSAKSVTSFVDFLRQVVIPAVGETVRIMGALVTVFHTFLSLPGVSGVARLAATFLLLAKGLTVIRVAFSELTGIVPAFLRAFGLMTAAATEAEIAAGTAVTGFASLTGIGLVVIAIAAVVAAIVLLDRKFHFLGKTFDWIKGAAKDAFDWIVQAAKDTVSWFSDVWNKGLLKWIRAPFVAAYRIFTEGTLGKAIIKDVRAVIDFLAGPVWATIKALIITPFKVSLAEIEIVWGAIRSIVRVALDVLAGRFDRIGRHLTDIWKGTWNGIKDALRDALNALIDMVNAAIDAINKVSPLHDIGHISRLADDTEDTADRVGTATDTMGGHYDDMASKSEDSAKRTEKSMERVSKAVESATSDSARNFEKLLESSSTSLMDIRQVTTINMMNVSARLGKESAAGKTALAANFRLAAGAVKKQMDAGVVSTREGMRAIRGYLARELQVYGFTLKEARNELKPNTRFDAGPDEGSADVRPQSVRATGGIISGYNDWPNDGHVVLDPYGRPTARVSGNEGIVNPPQMERINRWGAIAQGLGMDTAGSLQDLWGMRSGGMVGKLQRFQGGGQIVPVPGFPGERAARSILDEIAWIVRRFRGLILTDAYGQGHKSPGHTRTGTAADFSGPDRMMDRAVAALVRAGYLVGYDGRFGSQNWPGHGPSTKTPNFHFHVELGGKQRDLGSAMAGVTAQIPRPSIRGGGDVGRYVQRTLLLARAAAQRRINDAAGASLTQPVAGGGVRAMRPDANVVSAFRRAISVAHALPVERLGLWEAGIVESGLKNLNYGDADSLGALQERTSIYGRNHALNPYASALRFLSQVRALRPWRGSAGALAQAVQRSAFPARYDQVRGQAMRYMRKGGLLQGGGGVTAHVAMPLAARRITAGRMATALPPLSRWIRTGLAPVIDQINDLFDSVAKRLEDVARGPLRRSKDLGTRVARAFEKITGDGGLLDQIHQSIERISTQGALRLQQRQFVIGRGGPRRVTVTPAQEAQADLQILQATRGQLGRERTTIQGELPAAQRSLDEANRRAAQKGLTKAQKKSVDIARSAAQAALDNLRARLDQNTSDLAQNAQDQVEAVEAFQDAILKAVNDAADHDNTALDNWARRVRALGQNLDPNSLLNAQMVIMRNQITGLQGVLAQALNTGNLELANTVRGQIDELNTSIYEAVAQQFQNSIDAVNAQATRQNTYLDFAARIAQIGGTDYAALGSVLTQRGNVMGAQRAGLEALLAQATAAGNIEQINNLSDQIGELYTAMLENSQAIRDNTDAAFNAATTQITDRSSFVQSVFSGAQTFFQALTDRTGIASMPQQLTALQGIGAALTDERTGLLGQLRKLTGRDGTGLSGQDLANWLVSIATGPAFDAITASLSSAQQPYFRDLVTALLSNVNATESNTKAIGDLTGGDNTQGFSSSFWTAFRIAVFNGAGGLMPAYQGLVPTAGASTLAMAGSAMMSGTSPAGSVGTSYSSSTGGDTFITNVTSPTEVLDPVWHNRQLAFLRKTSGR